MAKSLRIVDGDIVFVSGVFDYVSGLEKLQQDVKECLLIERMDTGFGAGIVNAIGGASVLDVRSGILDSLTALRTIQLRSVLVKRDWSDVLGKVGALDVSSQKTSILFRLEVYSMSNQSLSLAGVY